MFPAAREHYRAAAMSIEAACSGGNAGCCGRGTLSGNRNGTGQGFKGVGDLRRVEQRGGKKESKEGESEQSKKTSSEREREQGRKEMEDRRREKTNEEQKERRRMERMTGKPKKN